MFSDGWDVGRCWIVFIKDYIVYDLCKIEKLIIFLFLNGRLLLFMEEWNRVSMSW